MAYANSHKNVDAPTGREFECGSMLELRTHDLFLNAHREYGYSTYDTHLDGSGVCYSSRLRPILDMRPDSHIGQDARWNFTADTHITDWLEAGDYTYDVITDEDLHNEGLALISPYRVLISGTHPEYTSLAMWRALSAYRDRGGRLMYLGGNGFYWRIAYSPRPARRSGGAPRRERTARLGCRTRRVLSQLHWRIRRTLALPGPSSTGVGRGRVLSGRFRRVILLPPTAWKLRSARKIHLRRGR